MRSPFANLNVLTLRVNETLHGFSRYRTGHCPGHDTVCWNLGAPSNADAVDLFCPAGTVIVACHDGTITRRVDSLGCVYVRNFWAQTVYCHLDLRSDLQVGTVVKKGNLLGVVSPTKTKDHHLHFEAYLRSVLGRMKAVTGRGPHLLQAAVVELFEKG